MVSCDERKDGFWGLLEAQEVAFQRLLSEGVITKDHMNKLNLTYYMRTIDQVRTTTIHHHVTHTLVASIVFGKNS